MDRDAITQQDREQMTTAARDPEEFGDPRWRVTLPVMWVAQLCSIMGFSFAMPFIPFFVRDLNVAERMVPVWAGVTGTAAGLAMSIMGPVWGYVADRYGRRPMVIRAMFGGSVMLALMGLAQNVYHLLVLRTLQGMITGTVPASVAMVSSVVPRNRVGASLGLMQMAVFTGAAVGPYLGGIVADRYGYRVPFGVTGALLFTGGMLVLLGARERFVPPDREVARESAPLRVLLRMPVILGLLGGYFVMNLSVSFVMPIFPLFVEEIVGTPQQAAAETGILLAVTGIAAAISAVLVGRLSDRVGHKRMLVVCTALTAVLSAPHFFAQSIGQLVVLRILFGLAAGGMVPSMNAIVSNVVPRANIGQAYGFTTTASALGWAMGPALGGVAAAAFGYRWPFVVMSGLLLAVAMAQKRWIAPGSPDSGGGSEA
jgi:DHA1 family multidrug resistance protein-like MFS transporter